MPSFGELKPDTYYLIQSDPESDIELVSIVLQTGKTVLLRSYLPNPEDFFRMKEEPVYKLVEEFDPETAERFESLYKNAEAEEYFEYEEGEE